MKTIDDNIRDLQYRFDQAQVEGNFETIENLLAPDIMFIGPKGYITDVEEWLTVHKNGEYKQTVMESINADVRVYGNTAILYDLKNSECEYKGDEIKGIFRTTQVWIKQQDRWQLTSVQFTPTTDH